MKIFIFLIIILASCQTKDQKSIDNFDIGSMVDTLSNPGSPALIMISPGQFAPGFSIKDRGIEFLITLDSNTVDYISTSDTNFNSPEGVRPGLPYNEMNHQFKDSGNYITGWGYVFELKSGWKCVFFDGFILEKEKIADSCKVKILFKKKKDK